MQGALVQSLVGEDPTCHLAWPKKGFLITLFLFHPKLCLQDLNPHGYTEVKFQQQFLAQAWILKWGAGDPCEHLLKLIDTVLSKHPTLAFSHRAQNSVLYI